MLETRDLGYSRGPLFVRAARINSILSRKRCRFFSRSIVRRWRERRPTKPRRPLSFAFETRDFSSAAINSRILIGPLCSTIDRPAGRKPFAFPPWQRIAFRRLLAECIMQERSYARSQLALFVWPAKCLEIPISRRTIETETLVVDDAWTTQLFVIWERGPSFRGPTLTSRLHSGTFVCSHPLSQKRPKSRAHSSVNSPWNPEVFVSRDKYWQSILASRGEKATENNFLPCVLFSRFIVSDCYHCSNISQSESFFAKKKKNESTVIPTIWKISQ